MELLKRGKIFFYVVALEKPRDSVSIRIRDRVATMAGQRTHLHHQYFGGVTDQGCISYERKRAREDN
jgi:hypothetical protein